MDDKQAPCFFKILIASLHSHTLKIPPDFVTHITKDTPDQKQPLRATIRGESKTWIVQLRHSKTGQLYMESGWDRVMSDNHLGDYEFILIRYDGNLDFSLQIFEKSGVRRCSRVQKWMNMSDIVGSDVDVPYFRVLMKGYNVDNPYSLRFPVDFARRHFPGLETGDRRTFMIENTKKQVWEVTAIAHLNSLMMSKGWRAFVRGNRLKPGHVCIFQYFGNYRMRLLVQ